MGYLYTKETKSSFEIEHITPDATRMERFVSLLKLAEEDDFFIKDKLVYLQNQTVDDRFRDSDYRVFQNYVGESVRFHEKVHFIPPKPEDLAELMSGMLYSHIRIDGTIHPILHATTIAYGFVFAHPFEDGNGRIHRFLIHNILSRRGFTPRGIMFPISAVMLKRLDAYNRSLEAFSATLLPLINYSLEEDGKMTVHNDTADFYRFIDFTTQAEALFEVVRETIDVELVDGLQFLINYDNTKRELQEIVDMPDRLIDLFINFCLQNNGKISKKKRE